MFGPLVIAYIFLGGAAGGSLLVASLTDLVRTRTWHRCGNGGEPPRTLIAKTYVVGLVLLLAALCCLLWDLRQPSRALLVFFMPRPTPLTLGAYTLAMESVIGCLLASSLILGRPRQNSRLLLAIEVLCCIVSTVLILYTAFYLISTAVPFWHNLALPAVFFTSSVSMGLSVFSIVAFSSNERALEPRTLKVLQSSHLVFLILEGISVAAFAAIAWNDPLCQDSIRLLCSPDMLACFLVGALVMGIAAPLLIETYSLVVGGGRVLPVCGALCLCGSLMLRYVIIACGVL